MSQKRRRTKHLKGTYILQVERLYLSYYYTKASYDSMAAEKKRLVTLHKRILGNRTVS